MKKSFLLWCLLATLSGIAIAWNDSRPAWDDAGISAFLIFSQKPWIIALVAGIWIPLFSFVSTHNYGGLLALIPGFIGAYAGFLIRKAILNR